MTATALRRDPATAAMDHWRRDQRRSIPTVVMFTNFLPAPATANTHEWPRPVERTAAGPDGQLNPAAAESTGEAIMEVRRLSGLTWEQLGKLFDVSRRSVHHWANGKPLAADRERTLRRMLAAVRHLDRGSQADTRALLLTIDPSRGASAFDLLKDGRFHEAMGRAEAVRQPRSQRVALSRAARDARRPPAAALLVGAAQDRPEFGADARGARAVRATRTSQPPKAAG